MSKRIWIWLPVTGHILLWAFLAVLSYRTSSISNLASCWHIVLIYFPPSGFLASLIVVGSLITLLMAPFNRALRRGWPFWSAVHGAIFMLGVFLCSHAAYTAVGNVACL